MGEQGTFLKSSSIRYVSLHFGVVTKYLLQGLEVCTVSAMDMEEGVQCVNRGYLWRVWILENVKGSDTKIVVFEILKFITGPIC